MTIRTVPQPGEVWFADLGMVGKPRYALVLAAQTNARLALVALWILPVALALFMVFGVISRPLFNKVQQKLSALNTTLQENLAGIKSSSKESGFKHLVMVPTLIAGLDAVDASHHSPYGPIRSRWNVAGDKLTWDVTIPVNSTATLHVPAGRPAGGVSQVGEMRIWSIILPVVTSTAQNCQGIGT